MNNSGKCPICGKSTIKEIEPFCSRRCADVDLARWFRGDYALPSSESEELPEDGADSDLGTIQH